MGILFKGYHLNLKRFVAIKVIRIDRISRSEPVSRFLREMQAVGQMDHPNVVRATDAGEKNGICYLVMEYLIGSTLSHLVAERGPLQVADACELTRQAALGLDYIHQTLIHRDIKPSNLMLTSSGLVKILDLGLARLHEAATDDQERTPEGWTMGTRDYAAPEQAAGNAQIDVRADIYSLGCTLFKLLTGRVPYDAPQYDTAAKKLFAHCHVSLTAIEEFQLVPPKLRPVLLGMTAKDPKDRYPTARETAQALAPFAEGSQLLQLVKGVEGSELPEQLLEPFPEELNRLMDVPIGTPESIPRTSRPGGPRPRLGWRRVLGIVLLAGALAVLLWFLGSALFPSPALPLLDKLGSGKHHLLDQAPHPIGFEGEDPRIWTWNKKHRLLEVHGPKVLLFPLGTTSQAQFELQVGITQSPWAGNVGVFWGYNEDAAARQARVPDQKFAWFQMVYLVRVDDKGRSSNYLWRGKGTLTYDKSGAMQVAPDASHSEQLGALDSSETILLIKVDQNRLIRVAFGSKDLTSLSSKDTNQLYLEQPFQGSIGLITLGNDATFGNVWFTPQTQP